MKNCLVKTIKGVVSDDDLLRYGEMKFSVPAGVEKSCQLVVNGGDVSFRLVGDGYLCLTSGGESVGKTYSLNPSEDIQRMYVHANGDCDIFINDDYNNILTIANFNFSGDITPLNYRNKKLQGLLINVANTFVFGEITSTELLSKAYSISLPPTVLMGLECINGNTVLQTLNIKGNTTTSNISNLTECTDLRELLMQTVVNVTGNLSSLVPLKKLTNLVMSAVTNITTDISVADLLVAWLSAGKTGFMTINLSTSLPFNGARLNGSATFSTNAIVVKDQNNNTIGTYDGSTWTYLS